MTGALSRNGRAVRQIRVLQTLTDRVEVVAAEALAAEGLFDANVHLHEYELPGGSGVPFFWALHRAVKRVLMRLDGTEHTVYHASDLYVLPATSHSAEVHGARLVYDARELYPFVQGTVGKPWATFFWSQLEGRYIGGADLILTVSESIADRLQDAYGVQPPVVLYNVPEAQRVEPSDYLRREVGVGPDVFVILHLGQIREGRGCTTLVRAMRDVNDAVLVFLGQGPERPMLEDLTLSEGLSGKVFFLDPIPYDRVLEVAAGANLGVSLLADSCLNHRFALPNKFFEYLTAGLPSLVSNFPELGGVVAAYDAGLTVDPASVESVAQSLQFAVDHGAEVDRWRVNTEKVVRDYNWVRESKKLVGAYETLFEGNAARS